ncbi:MAG: glycine dehydrogenase subunit 1 [Hyphomonadaceae bacterium]|nr:MAG: glycine dehydrogenase subunit 1 [Hyphomonadaceae bacterium]
MRYLPLSDENRQSMLGTIGAKSVDDFFTDIPIFARLNAPIAELPGHKTELEVSRHLSAMAAKNVAAGTVPFFCGAGAYRHHVPASVDHIIQRSEFLTTYTPYQPEIAQGTLQTLFEFQTQVARLLDCEVANASMYDGSTACAEAVVMAARVTKRNKIIISGGVHPHYAAAAQVLAQNIGLEIVMLDAAIDDEKAVIAHLASDIACVVISCPNVFGTISDLSDISRAAQAQGALVVGVFTEVTAFGLIQPLGAMGCDIVVGEGQSIGNALNFGGPYVGLFATREKYMRQMPGRLAGETVDLDGNRGFVLTLSTREQHIRREKATSNICTNSGLCALAFTVHLSLLGQKGLGQVAAKCHEMAVEVAQALESIDGVTVLTEAFFNEIAVSLPKPAAQAVDELAAKGVLGGVPYSRLDPNCSAQMQNVLLVAATETNTKADIEALATALKEVL